MPSAQSRRGRGRRRRGHPRPTDRARCSVGSWRVSSSTRHENASSYISSAFSKSNARWWVRAILKRVSVARCRRRAGQGRACPGSTRPASGRRRRHGPVAGLQEVAGRLSGASASAEVAGERAVTSPARLAVDLLQCLSDAPVELRAPSSPRGSRRRPPGPARGGSDTRLRPAAHLHDRSSRCSSEARLELLARGTKLLEERKPERPSDDCCRARAPRASASSSRVETGLQRALNERRDRKLILGIGHLPLAVLLHEGAALDEVAERLFQEERVAARPLGEVVGDHLRQLALRGERRQQPGRVRQVGPHRARVRCG